MALDYKRNYKTKLRRRKIIMISVIVAVFVCASLSILYFRYWSDGEQWNPFDYFAQQDTEDQNQQGTEDSNLSTEEIASGTEEGDNQNPSTEEVTSATEQVGTGNGPRGMVLTRQPIYLYTIGVTRVELMHMAGQEYVLSESVVPDSYFDDALFIGDSRTEGFMLYTSLSNIQAYCSKGLSVSRIYTDEIVPLEDGRVVTVMDALQVQKFGKIYIMFGINELGWPYDDLFRDQYAKMIKDIKTLQPEALIYVENIIPVSAARSATDPIYNNENVARFNGIIQEICQEQNVIYLDVGSALSDETGALPEGASSDGIHCNREYCDVWLDYLRQNTYALQ